MPINRQVIENGWSRAMLLNFIGTGLYERQGKALTNFQTTLPDATIRCVRRDGTTRPSVCLSARKKTIPTVAELEAKLNVPME